MPWTNGRCRPIWSRIPSVPSISWWSAAGTGWSSSAATRDGAARPATCATARRRLRWVDPFDEDGVTRLYYDLLDEDPPCLALTRPPRPAPRDGRGRDLRRHPDRSPGDRLVPGQCPCGSVHRPAARWHRAAQRRGATRPRPAAAPRLCQVRGPDRRPHHVCSGTPPIIPPAWPSATRPRRSEGVAVPTTATPWPIYHGDGTPHDGIEQLPPPPPGASSRVARPSHSSSTRTLTCPGAWAAAALATGRTSM